MISAVKPSERLVPVIILLFSLRQRRLLSLAARFGREWTGFELEADRARNLWPWLGVGVGVGVVSLVRHLSSGRWAQGVGHYMWSEDRSLSQRLGCPTLLGEGSQDSGPGFHRFDQMGTSTTESHPNHAPSTC